MKNKLRKKLLTGVLSLALAFSMTACGGNGAADGQTAGNTAAAGESQTTQDTADNGIHIRNIAVSELTSVDPNYAYTGNSTVVILNTYEGLMKYGEDGSLQGGMAESYDVSDDGTVYTFHIRDNAYWSNGEKVTAYDFLYSWQRLANPANGCAYAYVLMSAGVKNAYNVLYSGDPSYTVDDLGVSAPDENTFVVELDAPVPYFLSMTTGSFLMPVNQAFAEASGELFGMDVEHSIFNGPFNVTEWEAGGANATLTKSSTYYDAEHVTCDSVTYTFIADSQQQVLAWEKGEYDTIQLSGDFIAKYADDPALTSLGYAGMYYITFNFTNQDLQNKNLRLAISTAINKSAIAQSILADGSTAADYIIPKDFAPDAQGVTFREKAGDADYNSYDLTKAAEYFEQAKQELGKDNIELTLLYSEEGSNATVAADLQYELQTNLPGLTVNLQATTSAQRTTEMGAGNFDIALDRWFADYKDASTFLNLWTSTSTINYGKWENAEYDDLYTKTVGANAMDQEARTQAMIDMEKVLLEDAAVCPLYQPASVYLLNTDYNFRLLSGGLIQNQYTTRK